MRFLNIIETKIIRSLLNITGCPNAYTRDQRNNAKMVLESGNFDKVQKTYKEIIREMAQ